MDLGNLANKAKDLASKNRDKIEDAVDKFADSKLGNNADKAKNLVDKGLDKALGEDQDNN